MAKLFTTQRPLRFGDCDFSGTAYYPAYLNMLNAQNEDFFTHLGHPWPDTIRDDGWAVPTVHLSCDFAKASIYGDMLTFDLAVTRVGTSSVGLRHRIRCGEELRWTASQVLVASNLADHTSMPWPDDVRTKLLDRVIPEDQLDF